MSFVDPARLEAAANADPEFRHAARYWTATLALASPARTLRVEIVDGRLGACHAGDAGAPATVTITGPDDGWREFLAPRPRPFYQDLLGGCVQHHGFAIQGDMLAFSAYYHATQRLVALMRTLGAAGKVR